MNSRRSLGRRLKKLKNLEVIYFARWQKLMNQRLGIGLIGVVNIFLFALLEPHIVTYLSFLLIAGVFTYFVLLTRKVKKFYDSLVTWRQLYERIDKRQHGQARSSVAITDLPAADQNICSDLHLAGPNSVLGLMDETITAKGQKTLLENLLRPEISSIEALQEKQNFFRALSQKRWLLEKFVLISRVQQKPQNYQGLIHTFQQKILKRNFIPIFIFLLLAWPVSLGLLLASLMGAVALNPFLPIMLFFFLCMICRGQIDKPFQLSQDFEQGLKSLAPVFSFIETRMNVEPFLATTKQIVNDSPTAQLRALAKIVSGFSVQAHPIVYLVVNSLLPWDPFYAWRLESWRKKNADAFSIWLESLNQLEVQVSQGLFCAHLATTWPTLNAADSPVLEFDELYHPLIEKNSVVKNTFNWPAQKPLTLITGSNMSGKSTFLRTIGVNQILALMGLPVFAKSYTSYLAPVRACLQVTDNLDSGFSTFYFEVRQMAEMVKAAQNGEVFIYLIDEIFRGTNNRERLQGSRALILELIKYPKLRGLISTHDLELAALETEVGGLSNWHFVDDIIDGQMHFSYKIQSGPCPSTNALKIMAAEGLPT